MLDAAEKLEFERAATLRDKILELRSGDDDGPRRPAPSPQAQGADQGAGESQRRPPKAIKHDQYQSISYQGVIHASLVLFSR